MYAVEAIDLHKYYGKVRALNGLSLKLPLGEIVCLLGPNGAGKTTFLHLIATILKPTKGVLKVMGYDVVKRGADVRKAVGIAFQEPKLFWRFSPLEILKLHARIFGVKDVSLVEDTLRALGLWELRNRSVEYLSGGERKKVEIAKVLVQRPRLAIFDEPTAMVDVEGKHYIWDSIRGMAREGSSVIVATNEMYEAEVISEKVALIMAGKQVAMATPRELKEKVAGGDHVELILSRAPSADVASRVRDLVKGSDVELQGNRLSLKVSRYWRDLPAIIEELKGNGFTVLEIKIREPSLDEVMRRVMG